MTQSEVIFELSKTAFGEMAQRLRDAGYDHCFDRSAFGEVIHMSGIALRAEKSEGLLSSPWHKCEWKLGHFPTTEMPIENKPLTIRCVISKKVEYFLGYYEGAGQFRIETKAELLDDGTHHKLYSRTHAFLVTHWSYCLLPEE